MRRARGRTSCGSSSRARRSAWGACSTSWCRGARTAADGSLVLLADQDRSRWHGEEIAAGLALLASVPDDVTGLADEFRLQASIAAAHAVAGRATDTDWGGI